MFNVESCSVMNQLHLKYLKKKKKKNKKEINVLY